MKKVNEKEELILELVETEMTSGLNAIEKMQMTEDVISRLLCLEDEVQLKISSDLADWLIQDGYTVTRLESGMCKITY